MKLFRHKTQLIRFAVTGVAGLILASCTSSPYDTEPMAEAVPVSKAALPTNVKGDPKIEEMLACIRETDVLHGRTFEVGSFADSTGTVANLWA